MGKKLYYTDCCIKDKFWPEIYTIIANMINYADTVAFIKDQADRFWDAITIDRPCMHGTVPLNL